MRRGRPRFPRVTADDQLGTIAAVAAHMRVGRTWLSGVKRRQLELAQLYPSSKYASLPIAFAGGKTCAAWVKEFLRHPLNADFVPTRSYKKARR
jgi:hypothetical protein